MSPRTSTAERFIVEEPATLEEVQELFGIDDERAARLTRWVHEARVASDQHRATERVVKPRARRSVKKTRTKPASKR
jgi:hypothetical protein